MFSEFEISVLCLFCQVPLQAEEISKFQSGDLIKCESCGKQNDYDSVIEVAKERGIDRVKSQVEDELKKTIKNLFK